MAKKTEREEMPQEDAEIVVEGEESAPVTTVIEDENNEEIVVVNDESEIPKEKEDAPASSSAPDYGKSIADGFSMLAEKLASLGAKPSDIPQQEEGESDESFGKRYNEELFKDNPFGISKDLVAREAKKLLQKEVAPLFGAMMESAFENAEFRLKNDKKDGPIYEKYESEIKAKIATLPVASRKDPRALQWALKEVKLAHVDDIVEDRQKEARRAAPARAPFLTDTSSGIPAKSSSKKIFITLQDKEIADRMGIPVQTYVQTSEYQRRKAARERSGNRR